MLRFIQNFSLGGTFYFQQIYSWKKVSGCFMLRTTWPQLLHHSSASRFKLVNPYRLKRRLSWKFFYHNIHTSNKMRLNFYVLFTVFSPTCCGRYCGHFKVELLKEYIGTMWLIASSLHNN